MSVKSILSYTEKIYKSMLLKSFINLSIQKHQLTIFYFFFNFLQVIAFICGFIVVILMVLALTSTDWLMAEGFREGLFLHCIEDGAVPPLPFGLEGQPGCYASRDVGMYTFLLFFLLPL